MLRTKEKKKASKALIQSFHEISDRDMERRDIRDIIHKIDHQLMEERVFKLKGEEILIISAQLKELMEDI